MKPLTLTAILVATTIALSGCASGSYGRKFDDSRVAAIRKGETRKAQISQFFGEPMTVSKTSDMETWTYQYNNTYGRSYVQAATFGLVKEKSDDQMLVVVFKGDVVVEFTYTK